MQSEFIELPTAYGTTREKAVEKLYASLKEELPFLCEDAARAMFSASRGSVCVCAPADGQEHYSADLSISKLSIVLARSGEINGPY
jgi:hypothetical protein